MCNSTKLIFWVLSRWQLHLLLMLQEYWLLLPQRLELVQYLSPAEHGVCNRQSADYGFYARAHFFVFDRDSSFLSNTLSKFYLTEGVYLYILLLCRCLYTGTGWSLARLLLNLSFYSLQHIIPYLKPNFFHLVHPNSSPRLLSSWT